MEGLLLEAVASERMRDRRREARTARRSRATRRPSGSWVLSNSLATWLGR